MNLDSETVAAFTVPIAIASIVMVIAFSIYMNAKSDNEVQLKAMELEFCKELNTSTGVIHKLWVKCNKSTNQVNN